MHRLILAVIAVASLTIAAVGVARADQNSSGGCTPSGPALVVCYGNTPCPAGYIDPVGEAGRNIPGLAGQNIMLAPSHQRWLCQLSDPGAEPPGPSSTSTAETSHASSSPTAASNALPPAGAATPSALASAGAATSTQPAPSDTASNTASAPAPVAAAVPAPAPTTSMVVATSPTLGDYLTTPQGMTLYTRSTDSAGQSTCTGSCAIIWIPFQPPSASPSLPHEATGTINVTLRDDGTFQLTYNGMPLYTYTGDLKPGDVTGNGIGGVYQVAKP